MKRIYLPVFILAICGVFAFTGCATILGGKKNHLIVEQAQRRYRRFLLHTI